MRLAAMRPLLRPALALLVLAAAAQALAADAAPDALKQAFGNTIVSTYPDGRTGLLWLKADGTYTAKGRRRTDSSGTWSVKSSQVCLKQLKPVHAPFSYCTPLPSSDTWTAKAVTGEKITVRLVHGVQVN